MNISQLLEALKNPQISLTTGEKLLVGFSVAILSMVVVFLVLVLIAGIISLLQRNSLENENNKINNEKIVNAHINTKEESENRIQDQDMGELVSVITAAICAATGNSSNNIVVRKIVRSNNIKSSWESSHKKL
ncbi:MAG: OadG family transporter subunit [Peptostreptococcaceae bacterium]